MFGLAIFEIMAIIVFLIATLVGITFDRRGNEHVKWWVLAIGFLALVGSTWNDWTFSSVWSYITSKAFFENAGLYFGIGAVYCLVEFALGIRRAARYYKKKWDDELSSLGSFDSRSRFASYTYPPKDAEYVRLSYTMGAATPEPKIDKEELGYYIGAWMTLWPFYAASLILGDFLQEVFRVMTDAVVALSARAVKLSFKNVFTTNSNS